MSLWSKTGCSCSVMVRTSCCCCGHRHIWNSDQLLSPSPSLSLVWLLNIRVGVDQTRRPRARILFNESRCKQCYWSFLLDFIRISWTIVWWNETQHWITLFFKHWGKHVCIRCCWMPLNVEMFEWMSLLLSFNLWICFVLLCCCLRILLKCTFAVSETWVNSCSSFGF